MWKQNNGSRATYNNLIRVFQLAGYQNYADAVKKITGKNKPHHESNI